MLERMGINTRSAANFDTKNVAAVMVTADLPAFTAAGAQIDVTVAAMGDAKSLQGGTLLVTPLLGADGEAYAVAQGTIETGSISASGASGSSVSRGVPTAGRIAEGASVEREVGFKLDSMQKLRLSLRNPDFTTAQRIADVIALSGTLEEAIARAYENIRKLRVLSSYFREDVGQSLWPPGNG